MINFSLPEPPINERQCVICGKKKFLKGQLVHWPSDYYIDKNKVTLLNNMTIEPFSIWLYTCKWCRGIHTKKELLK